MPRLTFDRQLVVSLVLVALVPLGVFALIAFPRFSSAVRTEADQGAADAVVSVRTQVEQMGARLSTTNASYASWQVAADLVDRMDGTGLRTDVTGFLVDQGRADSAVVVVGPTDLATAGQDEDVAALAAIARASLAAAPGSSDEIGPGLAALPSGVHAVSVRRIDLGDRSGTGASAARDGGAAIAITRRLDGGFAIDASQLTGLAVSILLPDGRLSVTSDADAAAAIGTPTTSAGDPTAISVRDVGDYATGTSGLVDRAGRLVGIAAASGRLSALNAIDDALIPALWLGFGLSALSAVLLAILLSLRLRRRLSEVTAGMAAVAQGDTSVRLPEGGDDGIARLAASHNRLAATLARRDAALDRSLGAVAALTPDRGSADLMDAGTRAAVAVFGFDSARLLDAEGATVAAASREADTDLDDATPFAGVEATSPADGGPEDPTAERPPDDGPARPDPRAQVPIGAASLWLVARLGPGQEWSAADDALLALYGRQLGAALRDAQLYADASERAAELEQLSRIQGDFLRSVSHNLQTPLTRIEAAAGELRDTHQGDPAIDRDTRVIRTEGERLSHLVAQLLTLSRLDAQALSVTAEPIAIASIVRRIAPASAGRPVEIVDEAPGLIPIADEAGVEQVLWMLLDNAARYAPDGPIRVRISREAPGATPAAGDKGAGAGAVPGELMARVAVEDSGPGVPAAERERIFARFTRGSTAGDAAGTGLGLDVARGLVTAMGGWIRCEDAPGGGACFAFTLPAEDAVPPE